MHHLYICKHYLDKLEENDEVLMNSKLPSSFRNLKIKSFDWKRRNTRKRERKICLPGLEICLPGVSRNYVHRLEICYVPGLEICFIPGREVFSWSERACRDARWPDQNCLLRRFYTQPKRHRCKKF